MTKQGTLYICATPIGNLEDITYRAVRIMGECDAIACEDTRQTVKLLNHYGIKKPLISYHEHNERMRTEELLQRLEAGENIVLVSDAGLPGISDPGFVVVQQARSKGYPVTVLPGASAGISALVLSGMPCDRFVFEGFLPTGKKELKERLANLSKETRSIILYESPHRLEKTLKTLYDALGEREICIVRELTKIHEECRNINLSSWQAFLETKPPKGEYVLIVQGAKEEAAEEADLSPRDHVAALMQAGFSKKDAIKEAARAKGVPKNEIYQATLDL